MKLTITSLELKSPFRFFALSYKAMKIIQQLKNTECVAYKSQGFWTMHYTMSLWENEGQIRDFARSGQHLEAMKQSSKIAREIRVLTIDADKIPKWKEAKHLLKIKGKVYKYSH